MGTRVACKGLKTLNFTFYLIFRDPQVFRNETHLQKFGVDIKTN